MNGKLVLINIAANQPQKAQELYADLLGAPFARSLWDHGESYHGPLSADGVMVTVNPRHHPQETVTPYFAVDNLDAALTDLKKHGVNVAWGPDDLPISPKTFGLYQASFKKEFPQEASLLSTQSLGKAVLVIDAEGNAVGLVELATHAHVFFKVGQHRASTTHEDHLHQESLQIAQKQS